MDAKPTSKANPFSLFIQVTFLFATYASLVTLYFHNFIPEPVTKAFAERVSLFFSICFSISLVYLTANNLMPNPFWNKQSRFTKLMLSVFVIPLYYFFFWLSFASSLPLIYTSMVGETKTINEIVSREYVDSRKSCDYRLKFKSADGPMFHFCLHPELYQQLEQDEYAVETTIKQSKLGYYVKNVRFVDNDIKSALGNHKTAHDYLILVLILLLSANLVSLLAKTIRHKPHL